MMMALFAPPPPTSNPSSSLTTPHFMCLAAGGISTIHSARNLPGNSFAPGAGFASSSACGYLGIKALSEQRPWQEYEQAVERRDLGKALRILESLEVPESGIRSLPFVEYEDDGAQNDARMSSISFNAKSSEELLLRKPPQQIWKILDTCLNATDLKLVGRTYSLLQTRGLLSNFGKYKSFAAEGPRNVTPTVLLESAGLEASKLSPKKWGLSGNSAPILVASIGLFSFLVNNNVDVRPLVGALLALAVADAIYLGGTGLAQALSLWPPYKKRVLVHEAGHVLVAYLLGCPVRGVILDAVLAMKMGIQGQAGTQFWDETLEDELILGQLSSASFDRYCMVLFAGIAAEALIYGEAEGGENDENLFKAIASLLRPPWTASQMSNQARWAVLQSFKLLREHRRAFEAVVASLEEGASLGTVVKRLEEFLSLDAV